MTNLFEFALIIFLLGLLSFAYGEKVNNELVSNLMGFVTLGAVLTLLIAAVLVLFL